MRPVLAGTVVECADRVRCPHRLSLATDVLNEVKISVVLLLLFFVVLAHKKERDIQKRDKAKEKGIHMEKLFGSNNGWHMYVD